MILRESFERSGRWLFRWRSYIPLLLLVPTLWAMRNYRWPGNSEALQEWWEVVCLSVAFAGMLVRVLTVGFVPAGTSGRNTRYQLAASLNVTGMYSIMRHPLYVGNYLIFLGITLFPRTWWLPTLMTLVFWLYYERIMMAEEAYLAQTFGAQFHQWAQRTPAVVPRFAGWTNPTMAFSLRTVLRREYSGAMGIASAFFFLELLEHFVIEHRFHPELSWVVFMTVTTIMFLVLRTLKRNTHILDVQNR